MRLCGAHEISLGLALMGRGFGPAHPDHEAMVEAARTLIMAQAQETDRKAVLRCLAAEDGTPMGCLCCELKADDWPGLAAEDVAEFWAGKTR